MLPILAFPPLSSSVSTSYMLFISLCYLTVLVVGSTVFMVLLIISLIGKILLPFYLSYFESKAELRADLPPVNILIGAPARLFLCFCLNSNATYLERNSFEKTSYSFILDFGS